ncbi:hypothetical protein BH11MYX1_BH11MYX1_07320 [soil metagenome]
MFAMKRLLLLGLAVSALVGCKKADDPGGGNGADGGGEPMADAFIAQTTTDVSSDVTTATTWSGLVRVHASITVAAGVTLTIEPSTVIQFDQNLGVTVKGTVLANGIKGATIGMQPAPGFQFWNAWEVPTGGTVNFNYVTSKGGGITVTGGTAIARDSEFSHVTHDLLVVSAGTVDFEYSWIGVPAGQTDTTHCDLHFTGSPTIKVSHSNLSTAVYGVMFYGGQNADFTYDNWFANTSINFDKQGGSTTADISNSYFEGAVPMGSGLTKNAMQAAMVTDAGPR